MAKTKNKTSQKATKSYKNNQPISSAKVSAKNSKAKASNKSLASSSASSSAQTKSNKSSNNAQNKSSKASAPTNKAKNSSNNDDSLQITEHSPQQQKGIMLTQVWSGAITIIAGLVIIALASFGVLSATFNLDLMGAIGLVIMYLVLQVIVGFIIAKMYNLQLNDVLFKFHI